MQGPGAGELRAIARLTGPADVSGVQHWRRAGMARPGELREGQSAAHHGGASVGEREQLDWAPGSMAGGLLARWWISFAKSRAAPGGPMRV